jgi:RNA polymerase sigma factor (sigma-70 family)
MTMEGLREHRPETLADTLLTALERGHQLRDELASLPPRIRAAVVLRYYADLSVDEVAAALGTSRNTVKTQLRIGLDRLRDHLRNERPDPPASGMEANHV